jgi:hypothetical protein
VGQRSIGGPFKIEFNRPAHYLEEKRCEPKINLEHSQRNELLGVKIKRQALEPK